MIIAALVLAGIAALVHVYIFYMESIAWTSPRVRATFGTSPEDARATKEMAYNQGFYNLFLALTTAIGIVFIASGADEVGAALVFAGAGSMVAAATVLFVSSPDKRGAALKQGVVPLLAVICLTIGLALQG
jgi:putative membrane protein